MNTTKKKWMKVLSVILVFFMFGLTACAAESKKTDADTPEKAVLYAMNALKELDLDAFNAGTDNYVRTYRNWIGIPTEKEYRIFNELQQPGLRGRRYMENQEFAGKVVEKLSWKIRDIREEGDTAQINMTITNKDMSDMMGNYEISIMENIINSDGTGLKAMIQGFSEIDYDKGRLIEFIEQEEGVSVLDVTAEAYKEDGFWKIHVSDSFANAVMGNMNAEYYSDEIEDRLDELERQYEHKMEKWGDEFGDDIEDWAEGIFD